MGRMSIANKKDLVYKLSDKFLDVYGPIPWEIRYNAGEELVYTILSQHTSDLNSERAFKSLMIDFGVKLISIHFFIIFGIRNHQN